MDNIIRGIQSYLKKAGFNRLEDVPQFVKRNVMDILASLAYSIISGICVVIDEASLLVLFLNGLCMCRIILRNTMENSRIMAKMEKTLKNPDLSFEIAVGKYHYFIKSVVQLTMGTIVALCAVVMSFDMSTLLVKILTIVVIISIFLDDFESMCINMFQADVVLIVKKS